MVMKKALFGLLGVVMGAAAADARPIVVYYSMSGNTAAAAEIIRDATGADVFEITTADPNHYPSEYRPATEVAKSEIQNDTIVEINAAPDLTEYDVVFVGTPTWWGTMAVPMKSFLRENDLAGKTVAVFNTHEGSGRGTVHTDIESMTPDATHVDGIAIRGSAVADSDDEIKAWVGEVVK